MKLLKTSLLSQKSTAMLLLVLSAVVRNMYPYIANHLPNRPSYSNVLLSSITSATGHWFQYFVYAEAYSPRFQTVGSLQKQNYIY